ncbi:MAG: TolC family protein, partial [Bryobacteraceae bacterium]
FFIDAGPRGAAYQEALARAQEEVARRGLNLTVTTDYYALIVAQRAYATAQVSLDNARRFLQISQALERGGEVAHTDVIRFQLQLNQQEQALQNAQLAMSTARMNLAVLLFPTLNEDLRWWMTWISLRPCPRSPRFRPWPRATTRRFGPPSPSTSNRS